MLELTEIQYMAGEKTVLQNVTAGFPAGQVTGIVGPNGAGKSSLPQDLLINLLLFLGI